MLINGDSLEVLKTYPDNHFDSVVTDPPYGLSFMGKKWDYDVPSVELWKEVYRVLKPGAHLLAFSGSRTYHRMAVAIEDAGFEIRDMIEWVYGSGFPKSLNIGKAVDKIQGNEREFIKEHIQNKTNPDSKNRSWQSQEGVGNKWGITKGNSEWEGYGTALKPAHEPCVLARKPIEGNVAQNCLKYGVGGLNIDGSRVGTDDKLSIGSNNHSNAGVFKHDQQIKSEQHSLGRFPANLIHDGSDEVLEVFPETGKSKVRKVKPTESLNKTNTVFATSGYKQRLEGGINDNGGSAARFFYCAKSSKSERNAGLDGFEDRLGGLLEGGNDKRKGDRPQLQPTKNYHPTVKPIMLMRYLVKLVTPKGGLVLDPFNGSGTTGIACKLEHMEYVGIELDPEYVKISQARIDAWQPDNQQSLL